MSNRVFFSLFSLLLCSASCEKVTAYIKYVSPSSRNIDFLNAKADEMIERLEGQLKIPSDFINELANHPEFELDSDIYSATTTHLSTIIDSFGGEDTEAYKLIKQFYKQVYNQHVLNNDLPEISDGDCFGVGFLGSIVIETNYQRALINCLDDLDNIKNTIEDNMLNPLIDDNFLDQIAESLLEIENILKDFQTGKSAFTD